MTTEQRINELEEVLTAIHLVISQEDFEYNAIGENLVMKQHWLIGVIEDMRKEI